MIMRMDPAIVQWIRCSTSELALMHAVYIYISPLVRLM